jgi:DNA polymerase-1
MLAERIFGADYTPRQYSLAKNANFASIYGAFAPTLVRRYEFPSVKVANEVIDALYKTYKRLLPWKSEVWKEARMRYKKGKQAPYVETILGRRRRLPEIYSTNKYNRRRAERQAISTIISGSAADLFKVAMINCDERLVETGWDAHILMTVHDELVVEVPEKHADEGLAIVQDSLEHIINPFTERPMLSVPLVADAHIVKRWSEAKG